MGIRDSSDFEVFELTDLLHPELDIPISVGLISVRTSPFGSDIEKILELIETNAGTCMYDIIVSPEYSFFPSTGPLNIENMNIYLERLKTASKTGTMIVGNIIWKEEDIGDKESEKKIMHNTCYILHDGKEIYSYDKMVDCGETEIAQRYGLKFKKGDNLGIFEWLGLKCAIEICADIGKCDTGGVKDRDLYFLVSCGNTRDYARCLHEDGYMICIDGKDQLTRVKKKSDKVDYKKSYVDTGVLRV